MKHVVLLCSILLIISCHSNIDEKQEDTLSTSTNGIPLRDGVEVTQVGNWVYQTGGWNPKDKYMSSTTDSMVLRSHVNDLKNWDTSYFPALGRHTHALFTNGTDSMFIVLGDINKGYIIRDIIVGVVNENSGNVSWVVPDNNVDEMPARILFGYYQSKSIMFKDGYYYIVGGQADGDGKAVYGDIWRSSDGLQWFQVSTGNEAIIGKNLSGACIYHNGAGYVVSGGLYSSKKERRKYDNSVYRIVDSLGVINIKKVSSIKVGSQYGRAFSLNGRLLYYNGANPIDSPNNPSGNMSRLIYMDSSFVWHDVYNLPSPKDHAAGATRIIDTNGHERILITRGNLHSQIWVVSIDSASKYMFGMSRIK